MQQRQEVFSLDRHLSDLFQENSIGDRAPVGDPEAFASWQQQGRRHVSELLGIDSLPRPVAIEQELLHRRNRGTFVEEKWAVTSNEGVKLPVYFLVPQGRESLGPVLVFHGHNPSVQYILGNYPDEETGKAERSRDGNYAEQLAVAGHLVCAVEQRGFGERLAGPTDGDSFQNACRHISFQYQMLGRTMVGERCRDGMLALDLLRARPEVSGTKIAVTGNSGGGTTTFWLSAIEESLDIVITGCYFCSFQNSLMAIRHCECNYVPGAARIFEMGDIACLIAPRPQLFIQGEFDDIFPIAAARREFGTVQRLYESLAIAERVDMAVHPTGHAYNVASALAFLQTWM